MNQLAVDIDGGTKRFGGKRERYIKSLLKFASGLPGDRLDPQSPEALREVHTIKGVAANLGINSLYEITIECERLMKSGDHAAYQVFYDACAATGLAVLEQFGDADTATQPPMGAQLPEGTQEEYATLMSRLIHALAEGDAAAGEAVISQLRRKKWHAAVDIAKLSELVEAYEFDAAIELLAGVR